MWWSLALAAAPLVAAQVPTPSSPQGPEATATAAQDPARAGAGEQGPGLKPPAGVELLDPRVHPLLGRKIRAILVLRPERGVLQPMADAAAESVIRSLLSRTGQALELRKVTTDVANLWYEQRLAVQAWVRPQGEEVDLILVVAHEVQYYERVEFQGLLQYERSEVNALLGLYSDRQVTSTEARAMHNILVARYHRDGFPFVSIQLDERLPEADSSEAGPTRKIVTFRIDEGPRVTVGAVRFRGNSSYPGLHAILTPGDHLVRESRMLHVPGWLLSRGGPFSREVLEEDLDRLQLFYRGRGFLDASVTVADVQFTADRSSVEIDFLVVEGPRYTIRSVRVVHVAGGKELPPAAARYSAEEITAQLLTRVGDAYDYVRIRRDLLAIEDYYGRRGHPRRSFAGMERVPGAFRAAWPKEHYDETAGVALVFEIEEGTPKSLRDVVIRGNTSTRDRVIRRKIQALPGDRVDMHQIDRSLRLLEATRFFQNPLTLAGPRFTMLQVPGRDDLVDLGVDVTEAETGEFRWGVGISSGQGAQATFVFNKNNFDLWRPPSSWNPVTVFTEVLEGNAFHGGGQKLELFLAPGTQISQGQIALTEPDLFGEHFETTEGRVNLRRMVRQQHGYRSDTVGIDLGLSRSFSEEWSAGVTVRQENVGIGSLAVDATSLAYAAEGDTEIRGARFRTLYRDYDDLRRPTDGVEASLSYELLGGMFGADVDMWKASATGNWYVPIAENALGHRTVLHLEQSFGVAEGIQGTRDVFINERFYLGGPSNLRGFDFRGVGPSQFGRPFGGEALWYGTTEVTFPLVPTRLEREFRDRELLRGVVFLDYGLLGLGIHDPTFSELRMAYGVGLRIDVPVLEIPIALDLGWPIFHEETDRRRAFLFSISR